MARVIESSDAPIEGIVISDDEAGARPLAPDTVDPTNLNEHLIGEDGNPVSVSEAIDTYLRFNKSRMNEPDYISRAEYARHNQFPRVLEADRAFQEEYDGLTTAMLTRRLSPLNEDRELLTPWELSEQLHGSEVKDSIRSALAYQLAEFEWEWVAVTRPREFSGELQEHIHLWIDDPDDAVSVDHLEPARGKHLEYVPNAYPDDHRFRTDGSGGSIRVSTDPESTEEIPEEIATIITHSEYLARYPTKSAHFVATRLPDLIVWDYYDHDQDTPPLTLQEGAATGWAVTSQWFRTSSGIPPAEEFPPYS